MSESRDDTQVLAGEYVLGTLSGKDREAFEQRLQSDTTLQREVADWEERLVVLSDQPPVTPPMSVWRGIERSLDAAPAEPHHDLWWRSVVLWRGLTAAAVLGLVLVVATPLVAPPEEPAPVYSLLMQAESQAPQWMLLVDWRERKLNVTRLAAAQPKQNDHELWLLPSSGDAPISLGLLRGDNVAHALPEGLSAEDAKGFAVSLEPVGGSPTGAPTGPVLYVSEVPASEA